MICVLLGVPGSGKSNLARNLLQSMHIDAEWIELDQVVQFGMDKQSWKLRHHWARNRAEEIVAQGNYWAIVDDNHYYTSMRYAYYKIAKKCMF